MHPLPTLTIFVLLLLSLLRDSRQGLIFFELLMVLACLQYWVAPSLAYFWEKVAPAQVINPMPIAANRYGTTVLPLVIALWLGTEVGHFFSPKKEIPRPKDIQQWLSRQTRLPYMLLGGGVIATLIAPITPAMLRLPVYFAQQLLLVGSLHLLFLPQKKWGHFWVLTAIGGFLLIQALKTTMLGPLVWFILIVLLYVQWLVRWSMGRIVVLALVGVLLTLSILSWKYDYREQVKTTESWTGKVEKLKVVLQKRLQYPLEPRHWNRALCRLNQGYLTALALRYVPKQQAFVRGETIHIALLGSLVPRLLWPNKPQSGGKVNFERFTGEHLGAGVSMNIGPLGDAYVNFGVGGGVVFMFLYGLALRLLFQVFLAFVPVYPLLLLWLPLVFTPLLKVETDVLTVFNHAVKSTLFVICTTFILYHTSFILKNNVHPRT
jgi:uncharacterized membrane protein (Fun14 family)